MAQGAIVYRWGPSVRGRENEALQSFSDAAAFFDDLEKNHRITGHQPFVSLNRNGGMWVVQGDTQQLTAMQDEADWQRLTMRVQLLVEDWSAELCVGGSVIDLTEPIAMLADVINEIA